MLKKITPFLERFKKLSPPDAALKKTVAHIAKKVIHADISPKDITIQNGIIFIRANPAVKNEIFINKNILIERIKSSSGKKIIKDIK